ncbi:hypothetical protein N825_17695 [Skermanella stibiiresistens SB22]|uniref:Uncharacterized protein n=2 Tax=Skermanella TaxID=204447 RepID=W9GUG8_9PROT|nr:hypothetical protein N825_17695 [Skermanella stibiiresistens SB22]
MVTGGVGRMRDRERTDDFRTFLFLSGIAVAGLVLALGLSTIWRALIPPNDPLPKAAIFDPALRIALSDYGASLHEPRFAFTAATPQGTRTVANCSDYMKLLDQGVRTAPGEPTEALDAYLNCPLLTLLRQARQPSEYLAPLSHLAETVAERLDLTTLPEGFEPPTLRHRRFVIDETAFKVSSPDGSWTMTILASGSFSGDGREDVAARIERGSARQYVILSARPDGSLAASSPESLAMTTTLPIRLR